MRLVPGLRVRRGLIVVTLVIVIKNYFPPLILPEFLFNKTIQEVELRQRVEASKPDEVKMLYLIAASILKEVTAHSTVFRQQ